MNYKEAIESAVHSQLDLLFEKLVSKMVENDPNAIDEFFKGVDFVNKAATVALSREPK